MNSSLLEDRLKLQAQINEMTNQFARKLDRTGVSDEMSKQELIKKFRQGLEIKGMKNTLLTGD